MRQHDLFVNSITSLEKPCFVIYARIEKCSRLSWLKERKKKKKEHFQVKNIPQNMLLSMSPASFFFF